MASDPNALRSRRSILAAAAGGAAAVAATAAAPLTVSAAPTPMLTEQDNPSAAQTSITQSAAGAVAFKARTTNTDAAGLLGSTGDETNIATDTGFTGVYGWAPGVAPDVDAFGTGIWGDSDDVGTYGSGGVGVRGVGFYGMVAAGATGGGTGLRTWGGDGSGTDIALDVRGKALFSRSGRATISAGQSTKKINLTGVTFSSLVFAVLRSNRSGRYVRAVVPTTGSFTIYLNTTVTSSTYVVWFVVN